MKTRNLFLGFFLILPVIAGCGPTKDRVPVSGQVLVDGKPLTTGTIVVAPEDDRSAYGTIDPQGRFTLTTEEPNDGVIRGEHRVAVTATERTNPNKVRWLVPARYGDFYTSDLTIKVDDTTENVVIELSSDNQGEAPVVLIEEGDAVP